MDPYKTLLQAYADLFDAFGLLAIEHAGSTRNLPPSIRELYQRSKHNLRASIELDDAEDRARPKHMLASTPAHLYARPAEAPALEHVVTPPGVCSACGTKVSGQQIGGARKNGKKAVSCKHCGAPVAI